MDCIMINYTIFMHTLVNGWPQYNCPGIVSILQSPLYFILLVVSSMLPVSGTLKLPRRVQSEKQSKRVHRTLLTNNHNYTNFEIAF